MKRMRTVVAVLLVAASVCTAAFADAEMGRGKGKGAEMAAETAGDTMAEQAKEQNAHAHAEEVEATPEMQGLPEGLTEEMLDEVWMAADEAGLDENQSGMVTEKVIWSVGEGLAPRSAVDTATTTLALPGMEAEALLKATREALLEATKPETGKAMEHGKPDGHGHDMAAEKAEEKAERAMEKAEKKAESAMETADEMEE